MGEHHQTCCAVVHILTPHPTHPSPLTPLLTPLTLLFLSLTPQVLSVAASVLSLAQRVWHAIVRWEETTAELHTTSLDSPSVPNPAQVSLAAHHTTSTGEGRRGMGRHARVRVHVVADRQSSFNTPCMLITLLLYSQCQLQSKYSIHLTMTFINL